MIRQRGFTLLELMVVVVIIATLAIIAMSSYKEQVHKSRRTSAYNDIATFQLQLERWRAENPTYCNSNVGGCITYTTSGIYPTIPTNTYYTYPSAATFAGTATTTTYSLTATPTGDQTGDRCGALKATGNTKPQWQGDASCN